MGAMFSTSVPCDGCCLLKVVCCVARCCVVVSAGGLCRCPPDVGCDCRVCSVATFGSSAPDTHGARGLAEDVFTTGAGSVYSVVGCLLVALAAAAAAARPAKQSEGLAYLQDEVQEVQVLHPASRCQHTS